MYKYLTAIEARKMTEATIYKEMMEIENLIKENAEMGYNNLVMDLPVSYPIFDELESLGYKVEVEHTTVISW